MPYVLRLATGLGRPRNKVLGLSVAGRVEAVGSDVSEPRIGDEVYAGLVSFVFDAVTVWYPWTWVSAS
jgi:NADPH:quinone reductase-like Zn-dependent oxidoreductase